MPKFVSWRPKAFVGPDIPNWKARKFTYTRDGKESPKAFWVFDLDKPYRPAVSMDDYILVYFDFGEQNTSVITCLENKIDFENTGTKQEIAREMQALRGEDGGSALTGMETMFQGEARHPAKVIWKSNEPGAYGIGWMIRRQLTVVKIRLATIEEYAKALGVKPAEVKGYKPTQFWP